MSATKDNEGLMELISNFLTNDNFLFPFFSTLGATIAVLLFQFVHRVVAEKKKKIFAISYMYDVCFRILKSNLILKSHTILPHIKAMERIFMGETELLKIMFETGDLQILTEQSINFKLLPEEHNVLVGCDNIKLIQAFDTMNYLFSQNSKSKILNKHVDETLGSESEFLKYCSSAQTEILNTYLENLKSVKYENDRVLWFVLFVTLPMLEEYSKSLQFICFRKKSINTTRELINKELHENNELLPKEDLMHKKKLSGVQEVIKETT